MIRPRQMESLLFTKKIIITWTKLGEKYYLSSTTCIMLYCLVLSCAMLCSAVLCCAVPCCAVLCCAMRCSAMLCCAMLCRAMLCRAVLCCAVLCSFCVVLCCIVLFCIALHCIKYIVLRTGVIYIFLKSILIIKLSCYPGYSNIIVGVPDGPLSWLSLEAKFRKLQSYLGFYKDICE